MDWSGYAREFSAHDFSNFQYSERDAVAIRRYKNQEMKVDWLTEKVKWDDWSDSIQSEPEKATSYVLRAPDVFEGQPSPVSYLPFSKDTWKRLVDLLHVNPNITRTIGRRVAYFSSTRRQPYNGSSMLEIAYTARMSADFPRDVALSSTYIPADRTSYTVFYGCDRNQIRDIVKGLQSVPMGVDHPLLCLGIFSELERKRLVSLADDLVDRFTIKSDALEDRYWDLNTLNMRQSLATCVRSHSLMDQIRSVKRQLKKVLDEVDLVSGVVEQGHATVETGLLIKQRVNDTMDELDDKIDECNMMSHNLSLAMQTVWSQIAQEDSVVNTRIAKANTTIALESQVENSQMRSIAVLGMIYLPLSCVGSVFSTTIFNWRPDEGEPVISNYIWVLVVVSAGLTALTILSWHFTARREKIKQKERSKRFEIELDNMP